MLIVSPSQETFSDNSLAGDAPAQANANPSEARRIGGIGLLGAMVFVCAVFSFGTLAGRRSTQPPAVGPFADIPQTSRPVLVHVAGQVVHPGVYSLPPNARVQDAIQKAGGPSAGADVNALNLAAWAEDGSKIEVPAKAGSSSASPALASPSKLPVVPQVSITPEAAPDNSTLEAPLAQTPPQPKLQPAVKPERAPKNVAGLPPATTPKGNKSTNASPDYLSHHPIDLNAATLDQLQALPGIGPKMAQAILDYRAANGRFRSIDDLDNVKGIGEKKLEKLRPLVTVR